MEILRAGPTQSSTSSTTSRTEPSAGASTSCGSADTSRSGSRKKPRAASEAPANGNANRRWPMRARPAASAAGTRMNGQPSGATGRRRTLTHPWRLDPRHHGAQPLADLFDLVVGVTLPHGQERGPIGLVLQHPLPRELAGLDLGQDLLHLGLRLLAHDARPSRVVTELRGVRDRVAHVGQATLVEEVDDELHLVHALEVGDLGLVAGIHQRLEGGLDQVRDAAAEGDLLPEEIRLGLLAERRLEDSRP